TSTNSGYAEHRFTWDVARRIRRLLLARGADVRLTHPNDTGVGPCIDERARIGNRAHAVVALSIHADGGPVGGHGFHVIRPTRINGLTDDIYAGSRVLSTQLRKHLRDDALVTPSTYAGRRGIIERNDIGGLNMSDVPKCFVELGNMRNAAEARKLKRAGYREKLARVLARTLGDYAKAHAPA
ncbi:MAG: N-acetylmuramoyl-L-alanine amidase, partial [Thermoleophilia bacterium]|nr:N-acetylmuramoyl-L-alanine amidase [Thermoleophilia bacterium]